MKFLILFVSCFLFWGLPVLSQKKYYFANPAAGPANIADGSLRHPFTILSKLPGLSLKPADSVFFRGGDRFDGSINLDSVHGEMNAPIVFTSYGKGKAELFSGNAPAIVISRST